MSHFLVVCLAGWLATGAAGAQPPEPKPEPLTKEQQEKLKERDRLLQEANRLAGGDRVDEANALAEKALALTREVRGEQHPEALNLCQALAQNYEQQANFPAAKKYRQEILAVQTRLHGKDHWQVTDARLALEGAEHLAQLEPADRHRLRDATLLNDRVGQLYQQGKTHDAIPLAQKALDLRKDVLGERHPDYAQTLNNLALLYHAQGEYTQAEPLFRKALAVYKQVLGERHPLYAISLNNLALLYDSQGQYAQAERLFRQALEIKKEVLGERHPDYAQSLNNLAGLYESQGKYAQAEPLYREAREIRKQVLGERHPDYAQSLNNLAGLYESQGKYAQAEPLYRQALVITKHVLGERHPDYATSLSNLAGLYQAQGEYAKAEPLFRQALDLRKQVLGERHPACATTLNNLALLYQAQGEYAKAEPLYRQALEITKQVLGERHPRYATSLNNLAALYQAQGEYAKAEPLFCQARDLRKQVLGERHPDYAASLNNLAGLYQDQGEYAQVVPLLRQAREIYKQVVGEQHPAYAQSLNNLAALYQRQGEYAQAESLFRQALDIYKQVLGQRHPAYAGSLNNLAFVYDSRGEYAQAEPLFRQALEIYKHVVGERHPDYARSLNNLAFLYYSQGEYGKAEPLYLQVRDLRKQLVGERHPDYAGTLMGLGALYRDQGEYGKAELLFRQARDITKQVLGESHSAYAASLHNLAVLYEAQGVYSKAEPLHRQAITALRQRREGRSPEFEQLTTADLRPLPETVSCLANYCVLLEHCLGPRPTPPQLRAADHAFALALAVRERLRQEVLGQDASKLHHGAEALDLIPRRIGLCQRLFAEEGRVADLETAFATAEQGSARVFLEQLGKACALSVGRVSAELRAQEAALRRQQREFDKRIAVEQDKPADKRDPDKVGQLLDEQKKVETRLTALIQRMEKEYPQYAALKYPKPCSLAEARACLAPTEVALLFVPGDKRSYLIVLEARPALGDKANGLAIYPLPGHDDIADGTSRLTFRETFETPARARAVGAEAYELLLAPVKDRIRGKDLVIVPGGPLGYVPFEALVEDGRYLIEKHRIRYAPSLTTLHLVRLWEKTRAKPERPLWAMADPVYDKKDERAQGKPDLAQATQDALTEYLSRTNRGPSASAKPYPRLRFTSQEAEAIRARLGTADKDVLTGLQATEAVVKAASAKGLLARARYVHFATHGILGLDTGQQPALVLSLVGNDGQRDAEGGTNDGFLRLDEITRLQLNADLVVLSACETGKGRLYAGEGVTGLARAFLYAGSRGVVCSLWSVDDEQTAALMINLYSGLKDGQPAADALRAAKLAMIRAHKPPVFWAPFILIGE
jgi:tetratricopeptide (TPR) repeat protein/CHAT domain-containing protein